MTASHGGIGQPSALSDSSMVQSSKLPIPTLRISGELETRGEAFYVRFGLAQAPPQAYGLTTEGGSLVLGALRSGRTDYPAFFDPDLLEHQNGVPRAYEARLYPIRSSTTPPPPPPLNYEASLCLVVTKRLETGHPPPQPSFEISARPIRRITAPGSHWAFLIQNLPILVPAQCRFDGSPPRLTKPYRANLVVLTGMNQTGYHSRLWLTASLQTQAGPSPTQD